MRSPNENTFIRCITTFIVLISIIINIQPSSAIVHQIDYNDERGEYCYHESFNLGTCLGQAQLNSLENPMSDAQILQCLECSGRFRGDETCEEIKAYNNVAQASFDIDNTTTTANTDPLTTTMIAHTLNNNGTEIKTTSAVINWHESFCETYNICVETNCPQECMHEQNVWIECLVIELDCDWRCPGSDDSLMMMKGERMKMYDYETSGGGGATIQKEKRGRILFSTVSLVWAAVSLLLWV